MTDVNTRRSYSSAVRAEAALRTRRAIVAAARDLFLERGYTAASLRNVAERAGVARPTVTAVFGSKPALLRQITDEALAGDDQPVPVVERPWFRPVLQATTPQAVLDAYADACLLINGRVASLFEVVHRAAGESPEIAELWRGLESNRRLGATMVIERARACGPIRGDLGIERIIDSLWTVNGPTHYWALVLDRGWSEQDYLRWLAEMMRGAVLGHHPG